MPLMSCWTKYSMRPPRFPNPVEVLTGALRSGNAPVIPGRGRKPANPESIITIRAIFAPEVQSQTTCDYGFRVPRFARPRNDGRLVVPVAPGYANGSKNRETLHEPGQIRGRHRRQGAAVYRRGIPRKFTRWPRSLRLWRTGQGRHHAPGVPQCRALDRPALRRAACREDQGHPDLADRYRVRRLHPQVLPRRALA